MFNEGFDFKEDINPNLNNNNQTSQFGSLNPIQNKIARRR